MNLAEFSLVSTESIMNIFALQKKRRIDFFYLRIVIEFILLVIFHIFDRYLYLVLY